MPKIFISYRRDDSGKDSGRIYDRLIQAFGEDNVFKDVDDIPLGSDFRQVIIEEMSKCDTVIVIIGQKWLTITDKNGNRRLDNPTDFVRIEVETALANPNLLVVPVRVDNASMPAETELPHSLQSLVYRNAAIVRDDPDFHTDLNRLIRGIQAYEDEKQVRQKLWHEEQQRLKLEAEKAEQERLQWEEQLRQETWEKEQQRLKLRREKVNERKRIKRIEQIRQKATQEQLRKLEAEKAEQERLYREEQALQKTEEELQRLKDENKEQEPQNVKNEQKTFQQESKQGVLSKKINPTVSENLYREKEKIYSSEQKRAYLSYPIKPESIKPQATIGYPNNYLKKLKPYRSIYRIIISIIAIIVLVLILIIFQDNLLNKNSKQEGGTKLSSNIPIISLTPETVVLSDYIFQKAMTNIVDNDTWTPYSQDVDGVQMVLVPVGCFTIGSTDEQLEGYKGSDFSDEQPAIEHCITKPYLIDKYEVSNAQFNQFGGQASRESTWKENLQPRDSINWFEALAFCKIRGGRLPTELEWEYAARGPDNLIFPWGNEFISSYVVYKDNSNKTFLMGSRLEGASWVGASDLSGNVWEWNYNAYGDYPNAYSLISNIYTVGVLRGGAYTEDEYYLRSANRVGVERNRVNESWGFRCVRDLDLGQYTNNSVNNNATVGKENLATADVQIDEAFIDNLSLKATSASYIDEAFFFNASDTIIISATMDNQILATQEFLDSPSLKATSASSIDEAFGN